MPSLDERQATIDRLDMPTLSAVWLRPTPRQGAGISVSKIGGPIGWPYAVPWPVCERTELLYDHLPEQNTYYVPAAQFLKDDFPEIHFPPESDILQLLWCPRHHEDVSMEIGRAHV